MFSLAARRLTIALVFSLPLPALAIEDTPQNREQQADNYLQVVSPQSMMAEMAGKLAQTLPPDQREEFKMLMTKHLDMNHVTAAIHAAMVKIFTADELHALAEFYGSPYGKSAMGKMGDYMAEVMPATMNEVQLAYAKAQAESAGKLKQAPQAAQTPEKAAQTPEKKEQ